MKKLTLLAAAAVGYVLGTKAGRERYEQIKAQAERLWSSEPVQSTVDTVQSTARDAASEAGHKAAHQASEMGDKVTEAASEAASTMTAKVKSAADFASDETKEPGDAAAAEANEAQTAAEDLSEKAQALANRGDAEAAYTKDAIDEQLEETVVDEPKPGSTS